MMALAVAFNCSISIASRASMQSSDVSRRGRSWHILTVSDVGKGRPLLDAIRKFFTVAENAEF